MTEHTVTIDAPLTIVRHYLTDPVAVESYFCQRALMQAQDGGRVVFSWPDGFAQGVFTTFDDDHLTLTWHTDDTEDAIDLTLSENDGITTVTANCGEGASARWGAGLANLKSRLETGLDLRTANRPRLGVFPQEIVEEEPVGAKITGVLPGSGPDAVGIKSNDIIHSIEGVVLDDFAKFGEALGGKSVGDEVAVVFYRAGERHETRFALSSAADTAFAMGKTPTDMAALYAEERDAVFAALSALFDGVTDAQAQQRPAEGEWSAINVIAHLIHTERWAHQMLFNRLNDRPYSAFGANDDLQVVPYSAVYPTVEAALGALHAELERTRLLLAHLPEVALQRYDVFYDVAQGAMGNLVHVRSHFEQIENALAAAREAAPATV